MLAQLPPELSQRCHWKPYEVGLPDQLPVVAVSFWPTTAEPEMVGALVRAGAATVPPQELVAPFRVACAEVVPVLL